jgi:hypothetical protein
MLLIITKKCMSSVGLFTPVGSTAPKPEKKREKRRKTAYLFAKIHLKLPKHSTSLPQAFAGDMLISVDLSPSLPLSLSLISLIYLPSSSHFYSAYHLSTANAALCLSSTNCILLYPPASMSHSGRRGRLLLNAFPACNLCGESIYIFSTGVSEIIRGDAPKGIRLFSLHDRWIEGRPTDLDEIHFDGRWTWSCTFRVRKCSF